MNLSLLASLLSERAPAPSLRPYQTRAIELVDESIAVGSRSPLLVLPTGAGKTVIAAELTAAHSPETNGR